jgi:hypothetical protein
MADVDDIKFVIGGSSFLTSLGSRGVRIANWRELSGTMTSAESPTSLTTLINIQLLLLPVKIANNSGASGR